MLQDKEDSLRWQRPAAGQAALLCLQALLSHTVLAEHRRLLVEELGVLPLLQRVLHEHAHDVPLHSLVAQMVANLALDPALHERLFRAGQLPLVLIASSPFALHPSRVEGRGCLNDVVTRAIHSCRGQERAGGDAGVVAKKLRPQSALHGAT